LLQLAYVATLYLCTMALSLEDIKRLVIIAMASDDELMEILVLKGGNAIDLLYQGRKEGLSRSSYDLDFSMEGDFDKDIDEISGRIERTLSKTFSEYGVIVFDYKFALKPSVMRDEFKDFWGGYNVSFKITTPEYVKEAVENMDKLRRAAISIMPNGSPKFEIEISKYEYVGGKMETKVDGYQIYIYSPEMIVFEKVRAVCQQLPRYKEVISSHSPRPRARDFYDIYLLMDQYKIDPSAGDNKVLLSNIFSAKKVPVEFIQYIGDHLDIHRQDWQNVLDTLSAKEEVQPFDFYANFLLRQYQPLTFP